MPKHQGSENPNAKINESQAGQIKQDIVDGHPVRVIAIRHHVPESTVYNIIAGRAWTHVGWPDEHTPVSRVCPVPKCGRDTIPGDTVCGDHTKETLAARNEAIVEMRKTRSLFETAKWFGLTPSRVSQICNGDKPRRRNLGLHPFHKAQEGSRSRGS